MALSDHMPYKGGNLSAHTDVLFNMELQFVYAEDNRPFFGRPSTVRFAGDVEFYDRDGRRLLPLPEIPTDRTNPADFLIEPKRDDDR